MTTPIENIKYTALFVDHPEKLIEQFPPKHIKVYGHHSTIQFKPKNLDDLELGKKSMLKIIGRAFDDKGDVLFVINEKSKNEFAHITLSCTENTPTMYSNELLKKSYINGSLEMFDPVLIEVTEGYCDMDGKVTLN